MAAKRNLKHKENKKSTLSETIERIGAMCRKRIEDGQIPINSLGDVIRLLDWYYEQHPPKRLPPIVRQFGWAASPEPPEPLAA